MLVISPAAGEVVNALTSTQNGAQGSGLRISSNGTDPSGGLRVDVVDRPQADDKVIEQEGAKVFLDSSTVEYLDDKVLNAQADAQGGTQLILSNQS